MPDFTPKQKQVIDARNRDVLVSAAAGSGKTTVLVERIIQLISDEKQPLDIDRLLVVTFTRAAAREMREKIRSAIEKESNANPQNSHFKRQAAYVFHSQITTIDSFCNYIVKNYFYTIGVEPDFRILDGGEYTLLESEIIDEVLEHFYTHDSKRMLRFSDAYARKNSDEAVVDMVLKLANEAMTNPWPDTWLDELLTPYTVASVSDLATSDFICEVVRDAEERIAECQRNVLALYEEAKAQDNSADLPTLKSDLDLFESLLAQDSYDDLAREFANLSFVKLASVRKDNPQYDFHEAFKNLRATYKKEMENLKKQFSQSLDEVFESLKSQQPYVETLILLTREFLRKRQERLEKLNAWNFSDIEHFALEILKDKKTRQPTDVAVELRRYFSEIMVDEYQDSNYLQEEILRTITKEADGKFNYFMVGDIKQSIYRFRQARPEIFSEKYNRFTSEESPHQKIELDQNFRSRKEVLDATNDIFLELMTPEIGNVVYDNSVSLKHGATYYPDLDNGMYQTELLVGIKDKALLADSSIEDKSELEAVMIAHRILDLMKNFSVYDKDLKDNRKINYSDIVILLRSGKNASTFVDVLTAHGIPTYAEKSTGYFQATEVQTVLSMLRILDNPRQDIPMATVMHSHMFGFTNEELAVIRSAYPKEPFFKAVYSYYESHPADEKLGNFFQCISELRKMVEDTPIHVILQEIYERTGYLSYVYSLPAGESRRGNLYKLIDLAIKFETTSFKGLFRFCNYIDRLQKYESDMGEADLMSEDDDAVRIMTIHHSKGLEFPVVFLSEVSKEFNEQDTKGAMILHGSKGVAIDEISLERRTKKTPLFKQYISRCIKKDAYGEEMRVLYVAMTRAKEKLIITGTYDEGKLPQPLNGKMSNSMRLNKQGYGGWLIPIMTKHPEKYDISIFYPGDLVDKELETQIKGKLQREDIFDFRAFASPKDVEKIFHNLEYQYPYEITYPFKGKYSVSELKHRAMDLNEEEDSVEVFPKVETTDKLDSQKDASNSSQQAVSPGALKGTAMHRFMECFDFTRLDESDILSAELQRIRESRLMTEEDMERLDVNKLQTFLNSSLAKAMKKAAVSNHLLKEQPFVMGDTPKQLLAKLYPDMEFCDDAPLVLVQGIIDVFYLTEDEEGIVLVDYKTDRISREVELIERYKEQMELYQKAIEKATHKKVIKRVLYSFSLGKEVVL